MAQKQVFKQRSRGVPQGFVHNWKYRRNVREKKIGPKTWLVTAKGTKTKTNPTKHMGPEVGSSYDWDWRIRQRTTKVSKNKYNVKSVGIKKLVKSHKPKSHY